MALSLTSDQLQQISTHAERTYPEECCGLLIGQIDRTTPSAPKTVLEVWQVPNAWNSEIAEELAAALANTDQQLRFAKTDRYWIDPRDMLTAQRYARDRQLNIIGIYHSHPDHPAVPSECDRRLAWTQYSYLIVSVQQGVANLTQCWHLDETHQFQPEELTLANRSQESALNDQNDTGKTIPPS